MITLTFAPKTIVKPLFIEAICGFTHLSLSARRQSTSNCATHHTLCVVIHNTSVVRFTY